MSIKNRQKIIADAQQTANHAVQEVMNKDGMEEDEGVLFPVKNVWTTDKLRDDLAKEKAEKEAALSIVTDQAKIIEAQTKANEAQAKVIEELRKKLSQQSNSK